MLRFLRAVFAAIVMVLLLGLPSLSPTFGGDLSPPTAAPFDVAGPETRDAANERYDLTDASGVDDDSHYGLGTEDHPLRA